MRTGGDAALLASIQRFDNSAVSSIAETRWSASDIAKYAAKCPQDLKRALQLAAGRIAAAHRPQVKKNTRVGLPAGSRLEWRHRPLERVGCYVPGGRAVYPSTLLMCGITARAAGVSNLVVMTPASPQAGNGALAFALQLTGVREVWQMGGAHAIAAMAYGTESIAKCSAIVGPGNAWVAGAKRIVSGDVTIDSIAGPSEVLVLASASSDPELLAADLLAQAEHDTSSRVGLVSLSREVIASTCQAIERQLTDLPRAAIAREAIENFGSAICVGSVDEAIALANRIAPEHLQLHGEEFTREARRIENAGAVFLGPGGCEVMGDYLAGSNHVLPTNGRAAVQSALNTDTFMRSHWQVAIDQPWKLADAAATIAAAEELHAHQRAALKRSTPS